MLVPHSMHTEEGGNISQGVAEGALDSVLSLGQLNVGMGTLLESPRSL